MALRQIMPAPYQLVCYPLELSATKNQQGNKTFTNSSTPVIRGCTSLRVGETKQVIKPEYIDRVVTYVYAAVTSPLDWAEGDLVELPNMGTYRVNGDPEVDNLGPITSMNHLFGGRVLLKRVN